MSSTEKVGVLAILLACALNVGVAAGFFYAGQVDPHYSPMSGIAIRVVANLLCLVPAMLWGAGLPRVKSWQDGKDLWLWGFFGVLTAITYYYSVTLVGGGRATLLNAGSGVFVVAFAPLLTGQKVPPLHVLGALGCLVGMFLISEFKADDNGQALGYSLAIASGFFSAVSYLMVARGGTKHSAESVILHWTIVNSICISLVLCLQHQQWPSFNLVWWVLIFTGACAAFSQYLTAVAYQRASASKVACLSFVGPLVSVLVDLFVFRFPLSHWSLAGMGTIVICGLVLPMTR